MTRVWNITDGGQAGVKPHNRMVLGKNLKPGQYVQVDEARLAGATKIRNDVAAKLLHVGKQPPAWYAQKKKPPRAVADGRRIENGRAVGKKVKVIPGHASPLAVAPSKEEVVVPVNKNLPEESAEPPMEEVEKAAEEKPEEETEEKGLGRRRRRK